MRPEKTAILAFACVLACLTYSQSARAQCGEVLLYDVSNFHHVRDGAIAAGCTVTSTSVPDFVSTLTNGTDWQIVAMDFPSSSPAGAWEAAIIEHVRGGGRLLMSYWQMNAQPELAENLLVEVAGSLTSMPPAYVWDSDHPLFRTPQRLRMPESWGDEWGDNGDRFEPQAGAIAVAGLTPSASTGNALVVIGHGGNVIVNGFVFDDFQGDMNGNGVVDGIDFAENQFTFLAPVIPSACGDDVLDVGEECDEGPLNGTTPCGCQADCTLRDAGVVCGVATECSLADTCDGDGNCNDGGAAADGTSCGEPSASVCVGDPTCQDGACTEGERLPPGTVCGDGDTECLVADTCNADGVCVDGGFSAEGVACGSSEDSACDRPDQCDGAGFCDDRVLPVGTVCGEAATECRSADQCDERGECASGAPLEAGTPCGDPSTAPCDEADSCSGTGICRPNPQPPGTPCNNDLFCDGVDLCEGGVCRSEGSPCSGETTCDESSNSCVEGGPTCGDGLVESGEECDDGNLLASDGCTARCGVEPGYDCSALAPDGSSDCVPTCGDGLVLGDETCDDGNEADDDGCSDCLTLPGWECSGEPSVCAETGSVCGNGRIQAGEACDDGNESGGDGCGPDCVVEEGFSCLGEPSICGEVEEPVCGNGQIEAGERCDDNNPVSGDGCDGACVVEPGWACEGSPSVCTRVVDPDVGPDVTEDVVPDVETDVVDDAPDTEPGDTEPPDASDSGVRDVVRVDTGDTGQDSSQDAGSDEGPGTPETSPSDRELRGSGACASGQGGAPVWLGALALLALARRRR